MLTSLHIKDFAIIDELEVPFSSGLNVMTGETGAGKTIIVEALKLILGSRAQTDVIRSGAEKAQVTAVFDTSKISRTLKKYLADAAIDAGDEIIINRTVTTDGRGRITVNGTQVTSAMLKNFGEHLIDVSSQHEHQILLDVCEHAAILDFFGMIEGLGQNYRDVHVKWNFLSQEINGLLANEKAAKEKLDFLKFQFDELKAANLKIGEDQEIEAERMRLKHAVVLEEKARMAEAALYDGEGSALEMTDRAGNLLAQCAQYDPQTLKWSESLERAKAEISEASREIAAYVEKLSSDPAHLEDLEERMHLIRSLVKKHGGSIESCLKRREEISREMETVLHYDDILSEKQKELCVLKEERKSAAKKLDLARKKVAVLLGQSVTREFKKLGMEKAKFAVEVREKDENNWDENGPDSVEFMISANVGEPLKPLQKIASGGELSRVMLAFKAVIAERGEFASTSVFDEVDSGIGGGVAEVVGRKLKEVARSRQVICITHLPQVAAQGNAHYKISKSVKMDRTVANIDNLSKDERVEEIARMLGGTKITETTRAHAVEMLNLAKG